MAKRRSKSTKARKRTTKRTRRGNQTPAQRKGACAASMQAHGRGKRRAKRECKATDKDQSSFGRMGGKASGRAHKRSRRSNIGRRSNPSGAMIALASLLALGGVAGGYGLYKWNQRRTKMLPAGPEGPTQGETGAILGWEWLVDGNRIMVRPANGDWTVVDQAGALTRGQIEDLVSEYLRTVIWQPTSVMPEAIHLGNEALALVMPAGWDEAMATDVSGYSATSSNDGVATAQLTSWTEDDGERSYRILVTPMGVGTAIVTAVAPDQMMQARVVVG